MNKVKNYVIQSKIARELLLYCPKCNTLLIKYKFSYRKYYCNSKECSNYNKEITID